MEWTNELTLEFLFLYERETCIWDPKDSSHKNRNSINAAWYRIEKSFTGNFPLRELKRKKDSLMAMFRPILNRVKASKKVANDSTDVYKPTWFAYKAMERFLDGIYQPRAITHREFLEGADTSILEDMTEGEKEDDDDEQTPDDIRENDNSTHSRTPVPSNKFRFKANRRSNKHTRLKMKTKIISNRIQDVQHNISKDITSSKKQSTQDNCSLYAELLGRKLRGFDEYTREILMNKIDNLIFHAKMQNKNQHTQPIITGQSTDAQHTFEAPKSPGNSYNNYPTYSYATHQQHGVSFTQQPTMFHSQSTHQGHSYSHSQSSPGGNSPFLQPTSTIEEITIAPSKIENISEMIE